MPRAVILQCLCGKVHIKKLQLAQIDASDIASGTYVHGVP